MRLLLTKGYKEKINELEILFNENGITIYGDADVQSESFSYGGHLFTIGDLIGIHDLEGNIRKVTENDLSELFQSGISDSAIKKLEGRFLMINCNSVDGVVQVFTDRYGQFDCYYHQDKDKIAIASDLSLLPISPSYGGYDQVGLAHALTVYGYRPAKQHTLYNNVRRLGVGESVTIEPKKLEFNQAEFTPIKIGDYGEADHVRYSEIFLDALKVRGSDTGNVVYLSSGWDSTSILGGLVHIFGSDKVKAVIGRMRYSERAGVINPFEIERAQKVAEYYNVDLNVVEFDYSQEIPSVFSHIKDVVKNNIIPSPNIFTHGILADYIAKNYSNGESVFAGEISDGVHNLGFSQYATIFHPVLDFREYSDKMANYLYGPTFMDSFVKGTYTDDVIFNLLQSRAGNTIFDNQLSSSDIEKKKQLIASFFIRSQRMPLVSMDNVIQLTEEGRLKYSQEMELVYLQDAAKRIEPETTYSWYLHLYNSFHWQCATVVTLQLMAQAYGFNIQLPFYDSRLQEFLSAMPESWGRGLDLNPTKYPLKWMLKNKIDYPMHLQVGPHSYLYDVDHSFSHAVEIANYSAFTPVFRELLADHPYHDILSSDIFDLNCIDSIVDRYVKGEEITGSDLNILFPFFWLSLCKWY